MSYNNFGNNDSLDATFSGAVSFPLSMVCWIKNSANGWNAVAEDMVIHFNDDAFGTGDNNNSVRLSTTNGAADRVEARTSSDTQGDAADIITFSSGDWDNTWVPVVAIFESDNSRKIIIRDTSYADNNPNTDVRTVLDAFRYLRVGASAVTGFNAFTNGSIAEVTVFDKALDDTEVNALWTSAQTGPAPNTVSPAACIAYWPLDSDQASHADMSGKSGPALMVRGAVAYQADHPTITVASQNITIFMKGPDFSGQIFPPTVTLTAIPPNIAFGLGNTWDMSQYINDPDNIRTGSSVIGLAGFVSYDPVTELLTGDFIGQETGLVFQVDWPTGSVQSNGFEARVETAQLYLPIVPNLYSYGTDATFGRSNHTVYKVDNLSGNAGTSGSLPWALAQAGPKVIVFETSGMIDVSSDINVGAGPTIIAGQTAPAPGIWIYGAGLIANGTDELLVQHVTIAASDRVSGPPQNDRDSVKVANTATDVVFDHCTILWGLDETASIWSFTQAAIINNVTFSNCIIAEGLHKTTFNTDRTAKGLISGKAGGHSTFPTNVSIINNLFMTCAERGPYTMSAYIANNLVYNFSFQQMEVRGDNQAAGTAQANIIGNAYKTGPKTNTLRLPISLRDLQDASEIYVQDNVCDYVTQSGQGASANFDDLCSDTGSFGGTNLANVKALSAPLTMEGFTPIAGSAVEASVKSNAGSRPAESEFTRDRLIDDITNGTGQFKGAVENTLISADGSVTVPGGKPTITPSTHTLTVPSSPNADSGNGYTNLEIWLQGYADGVEQSIPIWDDPFINLPDPQVGVPYNEDLTLLGVGIDEVHAIGSSRGAEGNLWPDGLTLNTSTGVLSGTPTTVGQVAVVTAVGVNGTHDGTADWAYRSALSGVTFSDNAPNAAAHTQAMVGASGNNDLNSFDATESMAGGGSYKQEILDHSEYSGLAGTPTHPSATPGEAGLTFPILGGTKDAGGFNPDVNDLAVGETLEVCWSAKYNQPMVQWDFDYADRNDPSGASQGTQHAIKLGIVDNPVDGTSSAGEIVFESFWGSVAGQIGAGAILFQESDSTACSASDVNNQAAVNGGQPVLSGTNPGLTASGGSEGAWNACQLDRAQHGLLFSYLQDGRGDGTPDPLMWHNMPIDYWITYKFRYHRIDANDCRVIAYAALLGQDWTTIYDEVVSGRSWPLGLLTLTQSHTDMRQEVGVRPTCTVHYDGIIGLLGGGVIPAPGFTT